MYHASAGGFTARDPFEGMSETPYSLHSDAYGYSNPVGNTDPSGEASKVGSGAGSNTQRNFSDLTTWHYRELMHIE